ncbi:MAG: hypothetical protein Q8P51_20110 [Ignavibacteria bacterium]|nr:hypothetical protein [Ignavibacteria bacterium]
MQTAKQIAERGTPEKPPGPSGMVPETVAFIGTLVLAYWFSWSAKDPMGLDSFPVYAAVFTLLYAPSTIWKRLFRRNLQKVGAAQ